VTKSFTTFPAEPEISEIMSEPTPAAAPERQQLNPMVKLALDLGPLVLFFVANSRYGIFAATAVFMIAVLAALAASYIMIRRLPIMPVITAIIVVVFGGLTLVLHDATFIKVKPTIIYALFGLILLGGLVFNKPLLGVVFDSLFHLSGEGWRKLTLRWAIFFLALAVLNEIVWRNVSTDTWVTFKVFGVVPLTILFGALQVPLIKRYAIEPAE
jgi:intracellular septation protein